MTNLKTIFAATVFAVGIVVSPFSASVAGDLSGTLRVATWGGSWKTALHDLVGKKLEARGVKVEYVIGNPEDSIAKLVAARGRNAPFDVMEAQPLFNERLVKAGFIQNLNTANIPHTKALPPYAVTPWYVEVTGVQDGFVYNVQKFKEAGIAPLKHYGDLANPKLKGHVAFPDSSISQAWPSLIGLAYENGGSETKLDGVISMVKKIDPIFFYRSSTQLATKFGLGEVWVAPWHAGWGVRLQRKGMPIGFSHPIVNGKLGLIRPTSVHITSNTQNLKAAEAFIDTYISPEVLTKFAERTGMLPMQSGARKALMSEPVVKDFLLLSDEHVDGAYRIDWNKIDEKGFRDIWNREIPR